MVKHLLFLGTICYCFALNAVKPTETTTASNSPRLFNSPRMLNSPVFLSSQLRRVPAMHPHEVAIADFEKLLHSPVKQQDLLPEARTIAALHHLNLDWLANYYLQLHSLSKLIFYFAHAVGIDDLRDYTTMALNPGRCQLEPNGAAAVEFQDGFPTGFWSVLGYLPIKGVGLINNEDKKNDLLNLIQRFLGLSIVKHYDLSRSVAVCNPYSTSPINIIERTVSDAIPYDQAEKLWLAVKPEDREAYC